MKVILLTQLAAILLLLSTAVSLCGCNVYGTQTVTLTITPDRTTPNNPEAK